MLDFNLKVILSMKIITVTKKKRYQRLAFLMLIIKNANHIEFLENSITLIFLTRMAFI